MAFNLESNRPLTSKTRFSGRTLIAGLSALALALAPVVAEARPGGGKSSGSRGSQTNAAPPSTSTAPGAAQPMQRTATPNAPAPAATAARPAVPAAGAAAAAQAAKPSFARNMMLGLGAGLLGAGLFGLLSGSGLFSGLGSFASFLGLILQAALIAGAIYLVIRFIRSRREQSGQPAMAGAGMGAAGMGAAGMGAAGMGAAGMTGMAREAQQGPQTGGSPSGMAAPAQPVLRPLELDGSDFEQFEQRLQGVMAAYSAGDMDTLRQIATPEMVGYFADDLAENNAKGLVDVSKDVKLVKGDLSEAWSEGADEYATVAMRFSMINTLSERATGKIVEGHATIPHEATEIWTFVRQHGKPWLLSAIQQTA